MDYSDLSTKNGGRMRFAHDEVEKKVLSPADKGDLDVIWMMAKGVYSWLNSGLW